MGWRENFRAIGGHPAFQDMTGKSFGLFTVERRAENDAHGNARWHCRCAGCGQTHIMTGTVLRARPRKTCPAPKERAA